MIKRTQGRQAADIVIAPFTFADFSGVAFLPAVELPSDAIPLRVSVSVEGAFDATRTFDVGPVGTPDKYLDGASATALAISNATLASLAAVGDDGKVIGITPSGALTQGSGVLLVEYIRAHRETHTHG
jgi:hypothetical protein